MKAGWEVKPLGEVCVFENGDRGKNYPGRKAFVPKGIPFINAGHIDGGKIDWGGMNFIPKEHFDRISRGKIRDGDLLFCLRGSLGKFGHVDRDQLGAIASSLVIIRCNFGIEIEFLKFFLRTELCVEQIEKYAGGAAQPNLGATDLKKFLIPFPPLEEQKRIVAVLDGAFDALTRARAHVEANLLNARELFENGATEMFNTYSTHGTEKKLGEYVAFRNGLNFNKNSSGQEVRFVGVGDFQKNFWIPSDGLKVVKIDGKLDENDLIKTDDILAVRSNGNRELIGRVMLASKLSVPTSFSGFTIRIRVVSDALEPAFLCHLLKTRAMRDLLTAGGGGANISNLNQKLLSNLVLNIPAIDLQLKVIQEVEELKETTQSLQAHYQQKLASLDDLSQSLLQKAFAGELT